MSDLHDLYLVHAANSRQYGDVAKQESLAAQRMREKESFLGKEKTNSSLVLTFAGAREVENLSYSETKIAVNRAIEARQHAKLAIEAIKANKLAKQAAIEQIRDLESIRKEDEKELVIIRPITNSKITNSVELSDRRKLYYNAAKAIEREGK